MEKHRRESSDISIKCLPERQRRKMEEGTWKLEYREDFLGSMRGFFGCSLSYLGLWNTLCQEKTSLEREKHTECKCYDWKKPSWYYHKPYFFSWRCQHTFVTPHDGSSLPVYFATASLFLWHEEKKNQLFAFLKKKKIYYTYHGSGVKNTAQL